MWIYAIATGTLYESLDSHTKGHALGHGYSGLGPAKNDPTQTHVMGHGPIPVGFYTVLKPRDLAGGPHGPYVLPLLPDAENHMFGRSGFLVHGDNATHTASHGCIIMPMSVRLALSHSIDKRLQVIAKRLVS